jgi:dipeptidyl-peptidase-4
MQNEFRGVVIMQRTVFRTLVLLTALTYVFVNISSGEEKKITIEWVCSSECKNLTSLPDYAWLADGTALIYEKNADANQGTIERYNPATGTREPAIDRDKAMKSLDNILSRENMPKGIEWPLAINNSGESALYVYDNDIFLLDIAISEFKQITKSDGEEQVIRFSPDGKKISFVRNNNLFVMDLAMPYGIETIEDHNQIQITDDGSETILNGTLSWVYWEEIFGREDTAYWWSEDSSKIAYLKTDQSPVYVMQFVDFKPWNPEVVKQYYPKAGQSNPIVKLYVTDIKGKELSRFDSSQYPYEYIARVKWLPDNKRICVQTLNRDQTKLDIYFMESDSSKVEHILTETDSGWVEMSDDLYFLKDDKGFIWESQRSGYAHLYLYNMTGELIRQITFGNWSVSTVGSSQYWVTSSLGFVDEQEGYIYFGAQKKSSIERHLYRVKFDGSGLAQITGEAGYHKITFSKDGKFFFDVFSNIKQPPRLSIYTNDGELKAVVGESKDKEIEKLELQYPELFTVKARDDFEMPAEILKPKNFKPKKKYPVLVNVYGGPGAPTVTDAWKGSIYSDQILLDNGFIIFRFDNRSATDISKELNNLVTGQMWAECELNDLIDAVKWLKKQNYVDEDNIGIWGASGGGSYTLLGLTGSKEFKAGVAIAAVTDWHYYDSVWAEAGMKQPKDNPDGYEKTSFVKKAKDLHGRLLLVHGTGDDNVHPQNCWAFTDALIEAGIQFDIMIYPMRKHGITDNAARIHLHNTMLEFWNRNLK